MGQSFSHHVSRLEPRNTARKASAINDDDWYRNTLIPKVVQRGTAIIEARGLSSAASAANAAIDQTRDWIFGTDGHWALMAGVSDGSYRIPEGMICGVPVICEKGGFRRVGGLEIDAFAQTMLDRTVNELAEEMAAVKDLLADA